jgi:hypothetical protein
MRYFIVGLLQINSSAADLRVGMVVLELTGAQRKLSDSTTRAAIARYAGVSERTVTRSLKRMVDAGLIEWVPARGPGLLGTLRLLEPETSGCPAFPNMTRDTWMSRVQPMVDDNAGQQDDERETNPPRTRDTLGVPLPAFYPRSTHVADARQEKPIAERVEAVLNHIVQTKTRNLEQPIRNAERFRAWALQGIDRQRVTRLVERHVPETPTSLLAGAACGEPGVAPHLHGYRLRDEVAV